ncbi:hypothetical protein ACOSP7_023827 [Xanthoceras sorbifolium]
MPKRRRLAVLKNNAKTTSFWHCFLNKNRQKRDRNKNSTSQFFFHWFLFFGSSAAHHSPSSSIIFPFATHFLHQQPSLSENVMQGKSKQRRAWTLFDEESFLTALEDFVANGKRCDTGNFKAGSLAQMDQICPGSNLKANLHLESKLNKWKKNYNTIYDMINTSGFA